MVTPITLATPSAPGQAVQAAITRDRMLSPTGLGVQVLTEWCHQTPRNCVTKHLASSTIASDHDYDRLEALEETFNGYRSHGVQIQRDQGR